MLAGFFKKTVGSVASPYLQNTWGIIRQAHVPNVMANAVDCDCYCV